MCTASVIRQEREARGLMIKDVAQMVGVAASTLSGYERKDRPFPDDVVMRVAEVLDSPKILAEYSQERKLEFFNTPLLDNVDNHIMTILETLNEESAELIKAVVIMKKLLKNKRSREQLTDEEYEELIELVMQVADLYPALKLFFVELKQFGIDVKYIEKAAHKKLYKKGYIKKRTTTRVAAIYK